MVLPDQNEQSDHLKNVAKRLYQGVTPTIGELHMRAQQLSFKEVIIFPGYV